MSKKLSRNELCHCASGKKYKRCHGDSVSGSPRPSPRRAGVHAIYCDESGFTGNNLLDNAQTTFAYSAVAITPEEADALVANAHATLLLPAEVELKSGTLIRSRRGRDVLADIVRKVGDRSFNFVADKKFALSCKFFEYVFEPIIAQNNAFFYRRGFHKFIANLLYLSIVVRDASAEQMMAAFQRFMRSRNSDEITHMLGIDFANNNDPVRKILDIATAYEDRVADELRVVASSDTTGKWVLDLSTSAIFSMLGAASERFERLDVFCDDSKPIRSYEDVLNLMVGRDERSYQTFEGRRSAITFNLARPISFVSSKTHRGIQIADFVAGAIAYSVKGDADAQVFAMAIGDLTTVNPIHQQPELIDLTNSGPFLNGVLLEELHARALRRADPLKGLVREHEVVETYHHIYGKRLPRA